MVSFFHVSNVLFWITQTKDFYRDVIAMTIFRVTPVLPLVSTLKRAYSGLKNDYEITVETPSDKRPSLSDDCLPSKVG